MIWWCSSHLHWANKHLSWSNSQKHYTKNQEACETEQTAFEATCIQRLIATLLVTLNLRNWTNPTFVVKVGVKICPWVGRPRAVRFMGEWDTSDVEDGYEVQINRVQDGWRPRRADLWTWEGNLKYRWFYCWLLNNPTSELSASCHDSD